MDRHPGFFKNTRSANTAARISRASRVFLKLTVLLTPKNAQMIRYLFLFSTFLRPHAQNLSKARARSNACTLFYDNVEKCSDQS